MQQVRAHLSLCVSSERSGGTLLNMSTVSELNQLGLNIDTQWANGLAGVYARARVCDFCNLCSVKVHLYTQRCIYTQHFTV